ncbi:MAG: FxsA family protein [Parvibaculum sp.]
MPLLLFFIFIAVPVIEIAIFIQVGGIIGVPATIGIVLATAFLGASLLRIQGLQTWRRAEAAMRRGEPPVAEMLDGVLLFIAALLMVTPGLFTDCIGVALLIPPLRRAAGRAAARRLAASGGFSVHMRGGMGPGGPGTGGGARPGAGPVIEGEAEEIGDEDGGRPPPDAPDSPWRR